MQAQSRLRWMSGTDRQIVVRQLLRRKLFGREQSKGYQFHRNIAYVSLVMRAPDSQKTSPAVKVSDVLPVTTSVVPSIKYRGPGPALESAGILKPTGSFSRKTTTLTFLVGRSTICSKSKVASSDSRSAGPSSASTGSNRTAISSAGTSPTFSPVIRAPDSQKTSPAVKVSDVLPVSILVTISVVPAIK